MVHKYICISKYSQSLQPILTLLPCTDLYVVIFKLIWLARYWGEMTPPPAPPPVSTACEAFKCALIYMWLFLNSFGWQGIGGKWPLPLPPPPLPVSTACKAFKCALVVSSVTPHIDE